MPAPAAEREEPSQPEPVQDPPLDDAEEVVVELRVWLSSDEPQSVWARGWIAGQESEAPARALVEMPHVLLGDYTEGAHQYGPFRLSRGIVLWLHQAEDYPEWLSVQTCSGECFSNPIKRSRRPLGLTPLTLSDDADETGMRVADLRIVVPRDNPGLLRDREHLIALRDVLEGGAVELNWSVSTPTPSWEGVTVSGSPPRVTGLDLSQRGLAGELWGYIGDLTELRELRLDGNRLSGIVPSKMHLLSQLSVLYLAGNSLVGCAPPRLWATESHDLVSAGLSECPDTLETLREDPRFTILIGDIVPDSIEEPHYIILEAPAPGAKSVYRHPVGYTCHDYEDFWGAVDCGVYTGIGVRHAENEDIWLFVDRYRGQQIGRSHHSGCVYDCDSASSPAAWVEQLAASIWVNDVLGEFAYDEEQGTWVWKWP